MNTGINIHIKKKGFEEMEVKEFHITADAGLHARPATLLVQAAGQFQADITLTYKDKDVNLKSIMGVMSLGVPKGETVKVSINGEDEVQAMEKITDVMEKEELVG